MDYKNELNSDDDFDNSNGFSDHNGNNGYTTGNDRLGNTNGLSKAELRKTNKPIMEKRRRARINHCLNELKSLILEAMKKDPARHTKLEKADILEMTVKHLQSVQRQQLNMAIQSDPAVIHKFKTGFVECADEVKRYINQLDGVDPAVRQRLINHLNNYANSLEQIGSMTNFNNGYRGLISPNTIFGTPLAANPLITATQTSLFPALSQDLNNNNNNNNSNSNTAASIGPATPIQMAGVHLIPSRLPSGELALIVPNPAGVGGINSMGAATTSLLSGSTQSVLPFPTIWPNTGMATVVNPILPLQPNAVTSTPINDSMTNLKRNSAFTKPIQKITSNNTTITPNETSFSNVLFQSAPATASTVTPFNHTSNNLHPNTTSATSPPLSPISSPASVSSHGDDSSVMHTSSDLCTASRPTTPPSQDSTAGSQYNFCGVFNTPSSTETSSINSSTHGSIHLQQEQQVSSTSCGELRRASLKRSHAETNDSSCDGSEEEPLSKKFAISDGKSEKIGKKAISGISEEERDNMWRPW